MAAFAERQRRKMASRDGTFEGENVICEGPANHFRKVEGRGGWLTLTASRLAFRAHGKNLQNRGLDIPLNEIADVSETATLGVIPNGLQVLKKDGTKERFVISDRLEWIRCISRQLKSSETNLTHG